MRQNTREPSGSPLSIHVLPLFFVTLKSLPFCFQPSTLPSFFFKTEWPAPRTKPSLENQISSLSLSLPLESSLLSLLLSQKWPALSLSLMALFIAKTPGLFMWFQQGFNVLQNCWQWAAINLGAAGEEQV